MDTQMLERARRLLCALQDEIRATLAAARRRQGRRFAEVAGETAADTIFHVDRLSEAAIMGWMTRHWPQAWPVELVMEGLEDGATFPPGTPVGKTAWKLILDPIDGTRCIMYDKRSAWSLAGLAPQRGARTDLRDIVVAAMTELPTAKAGAADQFSAVRGGTLRATRRDLLTGAVKKWTPRPSAAGDCDHGFAAVVKFFPEGKARAAALEEALWRELGLFGKSGGARVFDDQYLSTGGQLYELLVGHDRFVADLRPTLLAREGLASALCCHPYDICTALLLEAAGGVVERPEGGALRAPLDTTSPVGWVGYANRTLAARIRPALRRVLAAGA
ncbi:inositol monophosphatase [Verrucomicrobia bacterium IMCC26134]|nr:inositol monophosphatase [Verrucomicrobia bacterium IMCC26134]